MSYFLIAIMLENYMIINSSDVKWLIWFMSITALSIGGTFVIIYIIKHLMGYFERTNR